MPERRWGVAGVVVSASSTQAGAATGAAIFPLVGPIGVVAMRQCVAAIVLLLVVRPKPSTIGRAGLLSAILLGLVLVVMNLSLYESLQRVGLGLAVTIEFLGPLGIALIASRRLRDLGCGVLAVAGIVALTGAGAGTPDLLGVAFGLLAAVAWAAYILLNQRVGAILPGITGMALASTVATIVTLPLLVTALTALPSAQLPHVLGIGALNGFLSSAVPYSLDLLILRVLPRSLFGMLQSVHPVAAAVFGLLVLAQHLELLQIVGIAAVCVANVIAVAGAPRPSQAAVR